MTGMVTKMTKKNKGGRPTVMTKDVLEKLEHAFAMGCTDLEASCYADIDPKSLYNYQKKDEDFLRRKEKLKQNPFMLARKNVHNALADGDKDMSKWFLERKKKDEFSTKYITEGSQDIKIILDEDDAKL